MSTPPTANGSPSNLSITATWEKPFVAATGGEATLMIRIAAAEAARGATQRRAPLDVAFVLDRSGSMAGGKLGLVKEAVDVAVGHLSDQDRAALTTYDHEVETLHPLEMATSRVKTAIRLALHGVDEGGSTNLSGGWFAGCQELSRNEGGKSGGGIRVRRALLLTDGLANVGITAPDELTHHAHELRKRGVTTTTLGVGLDFDEHLLAGMAEAGGGNFQFIERPNQLRAFFEQELGELLSVVAAGMRFALTLPHGVRARLVSAYPVDRQGKRLDIAIGDLPAGEEVCLIFELTVAPGMIGATHLATFEATWADPAADAGRSFTLTLPPLVYADPATVEATPSDAGVSEQAALQRSAAEQREAMRLDRAGRHAESRARMRNAAQVLAAAPQTASVAGHYASAIRLADHDEAIAYDEATRKRGVYDAHRVSRRRKE
jgi:Ca-activated chloride channel family protein